MVARRLLVPFVLAACHVQTAPSTSSEPVVPPPPVASAEPAKAQPATREIASADRRIFDRGVAALEAGELETARLIFVGLLDRYPNDAELLQRHAETLKAKTQAKARQDAMQPVAVAAAPRRRRKVRDAPVEQGDPPTLVQVSKTRNEITDVDAWFQTHGLRMPTWQVPTPRGGAPSELPAWIPRDVEGKRIVIAIEDQDHAIALYAKTYWRGRVLVVFDAKRELVAAYDFSAWSGPGPAQDGEADDRRIHWAMVREGVLFVSSGHFGYAKESGGRTAYLTALDLATGDLLWRSDPLVANARNFIYRDGYIISGYGFTAEPDFLFVIDAKTGKTVSKKKLRKGPEVILEKEGKVFVRTYDTDYVFDVR